MTDFVVLCRGCQQEFPLSKLRDQRCAGCAARQELTAMPEFARYRALWAKRQRYLSGTTVDLRPMEEQLGRLVARMSRRMHNVLREGAREVLNAELERVRSEVEGYRRVQPVRSGILLAS